MAPEEGEHVRTEVLEKPAKKQRSVVLDCFNRLNKDEAKIRLHSSGLLIKHLSQNTQEENAIKESKYTLTRLIRGLGATKNATKLGYYTTLTALLKFGEHDVEAVFEVVDKELRTSGNNSKSENADILTGHVLLSGAVLRSGIFNQASDEKKTKIIEMLINAAKKRSYLSLLGYKFIVDAFEMIDAKEFEKSILPHVKPEISKPLSDLNLDQLFFILMAKDKYPKALKSKFLKSTIQCEEILCDENMRGIARILMGVLPIKQVLSHPVYQVVCNKISSSKHIPKFVAEIDEYLSKPTQMSHHAATLLLYLLIEKLENKSLLPDMLTPNYIQQTLRHFETITSKNQDDLQLNIYSLFDLIVANLKEAQNEVRLSVLRKLMFPPGLFQFEKVTRSKVVQQITATFDVEGVKKLSKIYLDVLTGEMDSFNNDRIYAADLLAKLMMHPAMKLENEWKLEQLMLFLNLGIIKTKENNIKSELATSFKDTFFRALGFKWAKLEDLRNALSQLVHHIESMMAQKKYKTTLRQHLDETDFDLWKQALTIIDKLEKSKKKNHLNPVFHTLFLHMALQLFNDVQLARDSLNELFTCYEKGHSKDKVENEEDFKWIEVVVDLFMNLLSHKSSLMRTLIGCVFPYLCKDLTPTAIHQILSVLDTKGDANPLSDKREDSDSDSDDDEEEKDDEEEDATEEESDIDEEYKESSTDKLRQAVRTALGNDAALTDTESIDMDNMSDGQCEQLNAALGQAFKEFRPNLGKKRRKQTKEDEQLTHFRVRILDLIEIYLDSDVSMIICLEIMLPLLEVLEFSIRDQHQKPLQDRLKSCLKKLTNIKHFATTNDVDETIISDLLKSLIEKGNRNTIIIQETNDKISDCCLFLVRCAQICKCMDSIHTILSNSLKYYFLKRDSPTTYILFKSMLATVWIDNVKFVSDLMGFVFNSDVRLFKRNQAIELLRIFYTNHRLLSANATEFTKPLKKCEKKIIEQLTEVLKTEVKEKYVANLFLLLVTIKSSPVQTGAVDWGEVGTIVCNFRSGVFLSRDSKAAFNKLCNALKISNVVKMKPTLIRLNATEEAEAKEEKRKKKVKSRNEGRKKKKEAQMARLESMSQGLEEVNFDEADLNRLEVEQQKMEIEEENASKNKSKKRKQSTEDEEESDDGDENLQESSNEEESAGMEESDNGDENIQESSNEEDSDNSDIDGNNDEDNSHSDDSVDSNEDDSEGNKMNGRNKTARQKRNSSIANGKQKPVAQITVNKRKKQVMGSINKKLKKR